MVQKGLTKVFTPHRGKYDHKIKFVVYGYIRPFIEETLKKNSNILTKRFLYTDRVEAMEDMRQDVSLLATLSTRVGIESFRIVAPGGADGKAVLTTVTYEECLYPRDPWARNPPKFLDSPWAIPVFFYNVYILCVV